MRKIDALATALAVVSASPAAAKDVSIAVNARSGPWLAAANKKLLPYGSGDEQAPTLVPFDLGGGKIAIYADGTTDSPGKPAVGPAGVEGKAVDDMLGPRKRRYPSFYTPKVLYPANLHALIGVFVDAQGVVLGRPFVIGTGVRVSIPENAAALSFGFNDVSFAGNVGALKVTVSLPDE